MTAMRKEESVIFYIFNVNEVLKYSNHFNNTRNG